MAGDPRLLERLGRPIPEAGMQIADVELLEPSGDGIGQLKGAGPLPQPDALFLQRADAALGVRVALGVVVAREGLLNPELATGPQEGDRRRLAAVIRHQPQRLAAHAVRELPIERHVQRLEPMPRRALQPDVVADELLRVPVEHDDHVDPAEGLDQDLRHVDAPPLVRGGGFRLVPRRRPTGLEAPVRRNQQPRGSQEAQDPLLVHGQTVGIAQGGPDPTVAPERMLRFERLHSGQHRDIACRDFGRGAAAHPSSSSVFFTSSVRSATTRLSRLFSRSSRATWSAC